MMKSILSRSVASLILALAYSGIAAAGQPVPAPPTIQTKSFEQMLAYVYQHDPQLVIERQTVQMEDERVSQAYSGFRPLLSANGQAGRQREAVQGQDWLYGPDIGGSVVAEQPLFNGFGTLEQFRAAKARVSAGRARLLATEQAVLFKAIGIWLDLCEKSRIVGYHLDHLGRMYKYLGATETRFKAGDGTRTDLAQAKSRLAEEEGRYATSEAQLEVAQASYRRLTGMRPPVLYYPALPASLPATPDEAEDLARNHPELAQATREKEAAEHDVESASSALWPVVSVRGEMSEQRSPELNLDRLRDDSLLLNVSIPLYQGGAEYSKIREAKIAREKSLESEIDAHEAAIERARQAWANYTAANSVSRSTGQASDAALQAFEGVREEQAQGLRSTIEVLNAQSELLGNQIALAEAERDVRLEAYRLLAAVGRLNVQTLGVPTAIYDPAVHFSDTEKRAFGL